MAGGPRVRRSLFVEPLFKGLGVFAQGQQKCDETGGLTTYTEKVWETTTEDVAEKVTVGPFYTHSEVSEFNVAMGAWIPTQRFEVVQKKQGESEEWAAPHL